MKFKYINCELTGVILWPYTDHVWHKPFRHSIPAEPDIDWSALAAERQQREQTQQQQKGSQQ